VAVLPDTGGDAAPRRSRRRDLLIAVGAVGLAMAVPPVLRATRPVRAEPLPGLPGFRRVEGTAPTIPAIGLVGLEGPGPALAAEMAAIRADPDAAFPVRIGGALPIRVYSDFNCPSCRGLDRWLPDWDRGRAEVTTAFRPLAMLGPASERMALAALAGEAMGRPEAVRVPLWRRGLRPGPAALAALAEEVGLPPGPFAAAAGGADVARLLRRSRAEAAVMGVLGTPSLLVGRTLIAGDPGARVLARLVRAEETRTG